MKTAVHFFLCAAVFIIKYKSFVHLFKGGRSPEGGALWSLSAESEIP